MRSLKNPNGHFSLTSFQNSFPAQGLNHPSSVRGPLVLVAAQVDVVPSAAIQRQNIKTLRWCLVRCIHVM